MAKEKQIPQRYRIRTTDPRGEVNVYYTDHENDRLAREVERITYQLARDWDAFEIEIEAEVGE